MEDRYGVVEGVHYDNWAYWGARIRGCESGGHAGARPDYRAENPESGASGAYQFLDSTWAGRFGVTKAADATPEQQELAAFELFGRRGTEPWTDSQACWEAVPPPGAPSRPAPLRPGAWAPPPRDRRASLPGPTPPTTAVPRPSDPAIPGGPGPGAKPPPPPPPIVDVDKLLPPRR